MGVPLPVLELKHPPWLLTRIKGDKAVKKKEFNRKKKAG